MFLPQLFYWIFSSRNIQYWAVLYPTTTLCQIIIVLNVLIGKRNVYFIYPFVLLWLHVFLYSIYTLCSLWNSNLIFKNKKNFSCGLSQYQSWWPHFLFSHWSTTGQWNYFYVPQFTFQEDWDKRLCNYCVRADSILVKPSSAHLTNLEIKEVGLRSPLRDTGR